MTIQDSIQDMFHELITFVPRKTAIIYLRKLYPKMTSDAVAMALNRAIFDLQCNYDEKNDVLSMYKAPEISPARYTAMAASFRAAVDLMDSSRQIMRLFYPFEYAVVLNGKIYEVAYIPNGQETPVSLALKLAKVDPQLRPYIRRIGVVDYGSDISYIQRVGFSKIARITVDNKVEILKNFTQDEAWADMDDD